MKHKTDIFQGLTMFLICSDKILWIQIANNWYWLLLLSVLDDFFFRDRMCEWELKKQIYMYKRCIKARVDYATFKGYFINYVTCYFIRLLTLPQLVKSSLNCFFKIILKNYLLWPNLWIIPFFLKSLLSAPERS